MQPVLDSPMSPNERGQAFHLRGQAANKVTHLFGLLPVRGCFATDTHDALGVWPGGGGVVRRTRSWPAASAVGRRERHTRPDNHSSAWSTRHRTRDGTNG